MAGPVEVARFQHRHEADLGRALLEDAGIEAMVVGDDVGGMYPGIFPGPIRLVVAPGDADRARSVLEAWEESEGDAG